LFREELRRRHDRRLPLRPRGLQRRCKRDRGLARADVALQQPIHRHVAREVIPDLVDGAPLRLRERKRQRLREHGIDVIALPTRPLAMRARDGLVAAPLAPP